MAYDASIFQVLPERATSYIIAKTTDWDIVRSNFDYFNAPLNTSLTGIPGSTTNITTTSTSFVNVSGLFSATFTTVGGRVWVTFWCTVTATVDVFFDLTVDGTRFGIGWSAGITELATVVATPFALTIVIDGLSAASHTFNLQFKVTSGTATVSTQGRVSQFTATEERQI